MRQKKEKRLGTEEQETKRQADKILRSRQQKLIKQSEKEGK